MEKIQNMWHKFLGLFKEEQVPTDDLEAYRATIKKNKRKRYIKIAIVIAVILLAVVLVRYFVIHHKYNSYSVTGTVERTDSSATNYLQLENHVLRYSNDGASLTSETDKTIWNDTYEISNPVADICGSAGIVYEKNGTGVEVFNGEGPLGSFKTELPIIKAKVSSQGAVAAILEDGETTWINYYTSTGSVIASSSTGITTPGYPVDIDISENGMVLAVSFLVVDGDTTGTYMAFYNFGDAGQSKEDNLVSGFRYAGVLVPQVTYLEGNTAVAFREDGFTLFKGSQTPEESKTVQFDDEIVSAFYNDSYLGFVFKSATEDHKFRMEVYNASGKEVFKQGFDIVYDEVKFSGDQIIMNNSTQISVFSLHGVEKFTGNVEEGQITEIMKIRNNRYMMVLNGTIETIKLK